ncbi:MAG: bifunctional diaminohydroxyphosphoribosylaminopyrimidine deaminase/5-amino-6-(5-phosphoribosylamino)uracil reductase RibD, partial [Burkholderiales bacterium]|nr:bifunctional diaminohydroxyphosphoribosylaminopyrimidine deaminase/5-amino-6-(5-phosphoribosylamino)uracil reductase RibD [Burkholderiales bacterium]
YVTLEPCSHFGKTPPCADAVVAAGIARVVVGVEDPDLRVSGRGIARLRDAGIAVDVGVLAAACRQVTLGHIRRVTLARPMVQLKVAVGSDGLGPRGAGGEPVWITGPEARADGHGWRARACAILTGIGTVRDDDPQLTVRAIDVERQPLRVVVDRNAQTPPAARVLAGGALVVTAGASNPDWPDGVEVLPLPDGDGRVDLGALMRALGARGVNELHVEAGARLNGALLDAGLIDEVLLYVAPDVIGDPARGLFTRPAPLAALDGITRCAWERIDRVGRDLRILLRVEREEDR